MKIATIASHKKRPQEALATLKKLYKEVPQDQADVLVVLGGDGMMLRALHECENPDIPLYGMNLGTLGFLHNSYEPEGLPERLERAKTAFIHPLRALVKDQAGVQHDLLAYNEVALFRQMRHTARIKIRVNDDLRLKELMGDGVMVSTPMGSTAYNYSAGGPIIPLSANILPLTPISPFRPRRWPGALLPNTAKIQFDVLSPEERPVSLSADFQEIRDVLHVEVRESRSVSRTLMFDPGSHLAERIFQEQFPQ